MIEAILTFVKGYSQDFILVSFLALVFMLGWHCKSVLDIEATQKAQLAADRHADEVATKYEATIQTLNKRFTDANLKLEIPLAKPVYNSCKLTSDVVHLLDSYKTTSGLKK